MPSGQPTAGFRMTAKRRAANPEAAAAYDAMRAKSAGKISTTPLHLNMTNNVPPEVETRETDDEIASRIGMRFDILAKFTMAALDGKIRALIVSGPPGLGKSFTVEQTLKEAELDEDQFTIVKGYVRATGLYKTLYEYRHASNVIVFDDADSIFYDDVSLNLIKTACDTTEIRELSWLSEGQIFSEKEADNVPHRYLFDATVIFITNIDFDGMIAAGNKMAPHLQALISRAHYIDLTIKSKRDYIIRIKQVIAEGMLSEFSAEERKEIIAFISNDHNKLREYSLRMAIKLGHIMKMHSKDDWQAIARITCCR